MDFGVNNIESLMKDGSKKSGDYRLPNSYKRPEQIRGTIEYALDVLSRQYKMDPKEALPFNQVYDLSDYNNFNDAVLLNSPILAAESLKYVFYGDVVCNTYDDPLGLNDEIAVLLKHKDFRNKSLGFNYVACGVSAGGGVAKTNAVDIFNTFGSFLAFSTSNGAAGLNYLNTIKLEGHIIRLF